MNAAHPLRVLLVDPSLFTEPYDAALTDGLIEAGVTPTWAVRPAREGDREIIAREHIDDFFYRHVDQLTGWPRCLRATAKGLAHALGLAKLLRRVISRRPDVVHFQWTVVPPLDALAMLLIRNFCPVVVTVHDTTPYNGERLSVLQDLAFDLPIQLADRVIVHTLSARDTLVGRRISARKISVIPHGPLELSPASRKPTTPHSDGRWTFVLFGELKHYKGIDVLVEAVRLLPLELRKQARFVVAGRPRMDLAPLMSRIAELQLEETIEVRPQRLSEEEMESLFAMTDCYLFPYRQIDASGVYFLVKGRGKWLIATRVGIFAEDLQDGIDGDLIPAEDAASLAAALARTITERPVPESRTVADGWSSIGRATSTVYQEGIAARVAPSSALSQRMMRLK
ncbi:MAG TPA: glycosyltransferase [Polyangiaceae bacterium]|nr:glycosyltransferase [Polyangiaceae bacterium]